MKISFRPFFFFHNLMDQRIADTHKKPGSGNGNDQGDDAHLDTGRNEGFANFPDVYFSNDAPIGDGNRLIRGQDILTTVTKKKLIKSKSADFANVLRRTVSISKKIKRVSRGVYKV